MLSMRCAESPCGRAIQPKALGGHLQTSVALFALCVHTDAWAIPQLAVGLSIWWAREESNLPSSNEHLIYSQARYHLRNTRPI